VTEDCSGFFLKQEAKRDTEITRTARFFKLIIS
jgi:hypothetical protein